MQVITKQEQFVQQKQKLNKFECHTQNKQYFTNADVAVWQTLAKTATAQVIQQRFN